MQRLVQIIGAVGILALTLAVVVESYAQTGPPIDPDPLIWCQPKFDHQVRKSVCEQAFQQRLPPHSSPQTGDPHAIADKCSGILHMDRNGARIGGGKNENEGICEIEKSEVAKVLAICSVEQYCEAEGQVDLCEGSGECVQIKNIHSVSARQPAGANSGASEQQRAEEWVRPDIPQRWVFVAWQREVQVQLWSQNRPGQSWGPYSLPFNQPYSVSITCKEDEKICFGAWSEVDSSLRVGLGRNDRDCRRCCYRCDGRNRMAFPLGGDFDRY